MATGPLTWKNVPQTSDGAILGTINDAAASIGTGIAGFGDAFTNYADQRTTRDTDALEASLLGAGENEQARQAIMQGQDMSFIDQARLNSIEQGRQDKVLKESLWQSHLKDETDATIRINKEKPDKKISVKYGNNPLNNYFKDTYGDDDSWHPFGSGYDADDKKEFGTYRNRFLDEYGNKNKYGDNAISGKQFNQFVSDGNVTFNDRWFGDTFDFVSNGKDYNFNNFDTSGEQLFNAILNSKKKVSEATIAEGDAFIAFEKANPQFNSKAQALAAFRKANLAK